MNSTPMPNVSPWPRERARELLEQAIAQTELSARAFSAVLAVDERTVRRWLADDREIPGPVIQLCRLLRERPDLILLLGDIERDTV